MNQIEWRVLQAGCRYIFCSWPFLAGSLLVRTRSQLSLSFADEAYIYVRCLKRSESMNTFFAIFSAIVKAMLPSDHRLLDRSPNIGSLISRWELDKFKNCWNKSFRTSKILTPLDHQYSNLLIFQRDMSGPRLGALSKNMWSGVSPTKLPLNFQDFRPMTIMMFFIAQCFFTQKNQDSKVQEITLEMQPEYMLQFQAPTSTDCKIFTGTISQNATKVRLAEFIWLQSDHFML